MLRQPLLAAILAGSLPVALATTTGQLTEAGRQRVTIVPAPPDVEQFVEHALRDRLLAGDIPDIAVAGKQTSTQLYLRAEMPVSRMTLSQAALPELPQTELKLIGVAEAEERVTRSGERIRFVTVDRVQIESQVATVWLGADYIAPPQPGIIKLCCCRGEARFVKRNGRWVFRNWGASLCS